MDPAMYKQRMGPKQRKNRAPGTSIYKPTVTGLGVGSAAGLVIGGTTALAAPVVVPVVAATGLVGGFAMASNCEECTTVCYCRWVPGSNAGTRSSAENDVRLWRGSSGAHEQRGGALDLTNSEWSVVHLCGFFLISYLFLWGFAEIECFRSGSA